MEKTFNDFISSMSNEDCEKIVGDDRSVDFSLTNDGMQKYTNFIFSKSFDVSLNVLEAYHKWLMENFNISPKQK